MLFTINAFYRGLSAPIRVHCVDKRWRPMTRHMKSEKSQSRGNKKILRLFTIQCSAKSTALTLFIPIHLNTLWKSSSYYNEDVNWACILIWVSVCGWYEVNKNEDFIFFFFLLDRGWSVKDKKDHWCFIIITDECKLVSFCCSGDLLDFCVNK